MRSVEAQYNLNPEDLEEIMNNDWDDLFADLKYVAAVFIGLVLGVVLACGLMIFLGV